MVIVSGLKPGIDSSIDVTDSKGRKTRLVVLTQHEAEDTWKVRLGGDSGIARASNHLFITAQDFFADPDGNQKRIWLHSRETSTFAFSIMPPVVATPQGSLPVVRAGATSQVVRFTADAEKRNLELKYTLTQPAGNAPPVKLGTSSGWRPRGVAEAPGLPDPSFAARWSIKLPPNSLDGLSDVYLQVTYHGDVARFTAGNTLLTDNFYNGQPWSIGLRRFLDSKLDSFGLTVVPLRRDAPIYFELTPPPSFAPNGQTDTIENLRLVPEYQLVLTEGSAH